MVELEQTIAGAAGGASNLTAWLAQTVRESRSAIAAATKAKNDAVRAAEIELRNTTRQHELRLGELELRYADKAIELTEEYAPVDRRGYPIRPSQIWITEIGIELRWDADHPNDIVDATVTWEELSANAELTRGTPR